LREFVELLNSDEVEYLVIGGFVQSPDKVVQLGATHTRST
jgi:hypothetical protein